MHTIRLADKPLYIPYYKPSPVRRFIITLLWASALRQKAELTAHQVIDTRSGSIDGSVSFRNLPLTGAQRVFRLRHRQRFRNYLADLLGREPVCYR